MKTRIVRFAHGIEEQMLGLLKKVQESGKRQSSSFFLYFRLEFGFLNGLAALTQPTSRVVVCIYNLHPTRSLDLNSMMLNNPSHGNEWMRGGDKR